MSEIEELKKKLDELAPLFNIKEEQAILNSGKFKKNDPFPDISPALLNTADILDYILITSMIFPFHPDMALLKPASYAVRLLGKCVFFDEKGEIKVEIIGIGDEFALKKNSIAFVTLEPYFRLPYYIALRFNLTIQNVYRGLLLGTGPLVDPGFEGRLSLPLHNLTNEDYIFKGGEELVYFEFTKLSSSNGWEKINGKIERKGIYIPFPEEKLKREDVEKYLIHASPHKSIRSSLPEVINKAEKSIKEIKRIQWLALGTIAITVLFSFFTVWAIFYQGFSLLNNIKDDIFYVKKEQINLQNKSDNEIKYLKNEIIFLKTKLDSLKIEKQ